MSCFHFLKTFYFFLFCIHFYFVNQSLIFFSHPLFLNHLGEEISLLPKFITLLPALYTFNKIKYWNVSSLLDLFLKFFLIRFVDEIHRGGAVFYVEKSHSGDDYYLLFLIHLEEFVSHNLAHATRAYEGELRSLYPYKLLAEL